MLSKEQKLAGLRKLTDKYKADMAAAEKNKKKKAPPVKLMFGDELKNLEFVPTGILEFDALCGTYRDGPEGPEWIGIGGIPKGRFTIWWGSKSCGKTTMALRQVGCAQQMGLVVGYFNSERSLDPVWCEKQGVNLSELFVWEGGSLEQNMESLREVVDQKLVDVIVIDTIHAFAAKADTEGSKGKIRTMEDEPPMAPTAKKLSRFFRIVTSAVADSNVALLIIGQARQSDEYEELTGGHALLHYNSLTVHFVRINAKDKVPSKKIPGPDGKQKTLPIGFVMKAQVEKTRVNHRERDFVEIPFLWGLGPDKFEANVLAAVRLGIIQRSGAWYTAPTANGPETMQGKDALIDWVRQSPVYYDWLMERVTGGYQEPEELKPVEEEEEPKPKKKGKKGKK